VASLSWRSHALWALGHPQDALADADHALRGAREIGQAATLMFALYFTSRIHIQCGNYAKASAQADELITLADEKGALLWKAAGMLKKGFVLALTGKAADSVHILTSGIAAARSTGSTDLGRPNSLSYLASAYAELGQYDEAWGCISEAMAIIETTKLREWEAETNRIAGEIAMMSGGTGAARAEAYFERALAVSRKQQAKSWELRAAMSMARLWRDQRKRQQAHDLLGPVYRWFTEGFDTRDLKEAKALLDDLTA
jgi:predicted ATPase